MKSTIEQLRGAIDDGVTADKVAVLDPAAAPLGADEEAAGTPIPTSTVTATLLRERELGQPVLEAQKISGRRRQFTMWVAISLTLACTGLLIYFSRF